MPLTTSAKKAMRQAQRKQTANYRVRAKVKKAIDSVRKGLTDDLSNAYSTLDRAAKTGIVPKNKASRLKSRLAKLLKGKAAGIPATKAPTAKKATRTSTKAKAKAKSAKK